MGHIIVIFNFEHLPLEIAEGMMVVCLSDENAGGLMEQCEPDSNHEVVHKGTNTYHKGTP